MPISMSHFHRKHGKENEKPELNKPNKSPGPEEDKVGLDETMWRCRC